MKAPARSREKRAPGQHAVAWAALAIVATGLLVYANSFQGSFIFDDHDRILDNLPVHRLWPLSQSIFAPDNITRPLVTLSLVLNYQLSAAHPWSWHAFNLGVHILAGLTLFGIVRRTLGAPVRPPCGQAGRDGQDGLTRPASAVSAAPVSAAPVSASPRPRVSASPRPRVSASASTALALAATLLWLVHPLQTESVTYIIQRAEALMGLFYLLSCYCALRGFGSNWPGLWFTAAIATCVLGAGCKQTIVTAPLVILLYDRIFVAGSWRGALSRRSPLYAGLSLSWLIAGGLLLFTGPILSAGFELPNLSTRDYALNQGNVILHYLRLCVWPGPLCLDYGWVASKNIWALLPGLGAVSLLLGLTVYTLWRASAWAFWGGWFFLTLAPTSSVLPIIDLAAEHRLYLPLAAVAVAASAGAWWLAQWVAQASCLREPRASVEQTDAGWKPALQSRLEACATRRGQIVFAVLILLAVAALSVRTVRRNALYHVESDVWREVVDLAPQNARAHFTLGAALANEDHYREALPNYIAALGLNPKYLDACNNAGLAFASLGRLREAVACYERGAAIQPHPELLNNWGVALGRQNELAEAQKKFAQALEVKPNFGKPHANWGFALSRQGRIREAIEHYREGLRLDPENATAHLNLAEALDQEGQANQAVAEYRAALNLREDLLDGLERLGWLLATSPDAAVRNGPQALTLAQAAGALCHENQPDVMDVLGAAYAETGRFPEALAAAEKALSLARAASMPQAAAGIEQRLKCYQAGQPWREKR